MNDTSHGEIDTETPVNPYSLLEAVNRSSGGANAAWLIYLALMSYLLITIAGIGHKDLLLNSDIALPILQVKIELTRFFLFAPILLVLIHVGLVSQLVLLARKTLEFAAAIRMLETTEQRTHPLRLELDNFFFVQAIAGPERSRIVGFFLHGMSWLTLVVMPVILLLYVQLVFLPYHDVTITWAHRVVLMADIALLVFIGVFLWRLETSFFRAFWRTSLHHPIGLAFTAVLLAVVAAFSLTVATIPGEAIEGSARQANARGAGYILGYAVPGLGAAQEGSLFGLFHRNLIVTDVDLVVDKDVTPGEPSINLRGRDLRFAKLDRTDLHQADMTGANLEGASLVGADLRGVWLSCGDLNELLLTNSRGAARCASARGTNFVQGSPVRGQDGRHRFARGQARGGAARRRPARPCPDDGRELCQRPARSRRFHGRLAAWGQLPAGLPAGRRPLGRQAADGRLHQRRHARRQSLPCQPRRRGAARCRARGREPAHGRRCTVPTWRAPRCRAATWRVRRCGAPRRPAARSGRSPTWPRSSCGRRARTS